MLKRSLILTGLALLGFAAWAALQARPGSGMAGLPGTTLWAWERPEHLSFVDPKRTAVAVLAATIDLTDGEPRIEPRKQPVTLAKDQPTIAVFRIQGSSSVLISEPTRRRVVYEITEHSLYAIADAVQIDFDATASQRDFYRALLKDLRAQLPKHIPLSMTALVSWCEGDDWISDLPVDEAVPMYFRMGVDAQTIRRSHWEVGRLREPLCRGSVGISLDEPWPRFGRGVRVYAFAPKPWTEPDYQHLLERFAR